MDRIIESSALLFINSWAAHNHVLAAAIEQRAAHDTAAPSADELTPPHWFTPHFDSWALTYVFDDNTQAENAINGLFGLVPPESAVTAWRYLHDLIDNTQTPNEGKRQLLLGHVVERWSLLARAWNGLSVKSKNDLNNRYKFLFECLLSKDFSPVGLSSQEVAGLPVLNVGLLDEVLVIVKQELAKNRKFTILACHLYAMVETLEGHGQIPRSKRGVITRFVAERIGVKVRKSYVPDRTRQKAFNYDEPNDDYTLAIEATREALRRLQIITEAESFRLPIRRPARPKRTI